MTVSYARAPVRIDFAGGWSDVPVFAEVEGGGVVNAAIALHVHAECRVGGGKIRLIAEDLQQRLTIPSAAKINYDGVLDLHKAALNMLPVLGGVELITRSEVPPGSGLGASGSLDVALIALLAHCRGEDHFDREDLAELGFALETSELGLLGGRQDQYAAALGGFHHLGFSGAGVTVSPLDVSSTRAAELHDWLSLVYTGQSHFSSQTHERVWAAYHEGDSRVADAIRHIGALVAPTARAIAAGNWEELAKLIDQNWVEQQALDLTIATEGVKGIERVARNAGAIGAKATGAGAGGCMIFVAPPSARAAVCEAVTRAGARVMDYQFTFDGVETWQRD
jgi:D-glycero-alpha-D-manno-heptose-7-phosphate kinase